MVDFRSEKLTVSRQAELLSLNRSSLYYNPVDISDDETSRNRRPASQESIGVSLGRRNNFVFRWSKVRIKGGARSGPTAQVSAKYGQDPGVTLYTHISDQYSPYHVKVISVTAKDAPYVLDGLLYHERQNSTLKNIIRTRRDTRIISSPCVTF